MNRRRYACLLALATALALPQTAGAADPSGPARAAVNVCGPSGSGDVGVRVNAPYRGETVSPWVRIAIQYYSDHDGGWHPAAGGDSGWFQAGPAGTGADTGYTFPYRAPDKGGKLVMRGVVEIQWRPGGADSQFVTGACEVDGPPVS